MGEHLDVLRKAFKTSQKVLKPVSRKNERPSGETREANGTCCVPECFVIDSGGNACMVSPPLPLL